jgi:hypothetical protein
VTGHLAELVVASSLAVAVIGSAAAMTQQERASHALLVERAVAREAAEGLLARASVTPAADGTHAIDVARLLPKAGRLPHVAATVSVEAAGANGALVRVTVELTWAARQGRQTVRLTTQAERRR